MLRFGDVILSEVQFTDTFETKVRPALVLFEEYGTVVVAGITSNTGMKGMALSRKDGAVKDSVIKLNYIFTVAEAMVKKALFRLPEQKNREVRAELMKKLG